MRKKQTYMLYIMPSEGEPAVICGQMKDIATGEIYTFHNLDELNRLIQQETRVRQIREEKAMYAAQPSEAEIHPKR